MLLRVTLKPILGIHLTTKTYTVALLKDESAPNGHSKTYIGPPP